MESIKVVPMELQHINGVLQVERLSFHAPWSREAFLCELTSNPNAFYLVAEMEHQIVGYIGIWMILDEGHITNLAVHPECRRHHIGERLLITLMEEMKARNITKMTLEVRVSNTGAQKLYHKLGFIGVGVRPGYYQNNNEDAMIMWKDL